MIVQQFIEIVVQSLHKLQAFELAAANAARSGEINAGGFDRRMAEHVGESCDVVKSFIENGGKKMAQVVRKDFAWRDACFFCEVFSFRPTPGSGSWVFRLR